MDLRSLHSVLPGFVSRLDMFLLELINEIPKDFNNVKTYINHLIKVAIKEIQVDLPHASHE